MKLFKYALIFSAVLFLSTVALAKNTPEFDAVGTDSDNYFTQNTIYYTVINDRYPGLEEDSYFDTTVLGGYYGASGNPLFMNLSERFESNGGQAQFSPCYDGMPVVLTDADNQGIYEWWIVLQRKPESDININIMDCVLKFNETDIWTHADQTGRYRMPWNELIFNASRNPMISAEAYPGPYATTGFDTPLTLDARTLPGLTRVALNEVLYTSKGLFPEGIVVALPDTGVDNISGQVESNLKQGDIIHVKVEVPGTNSVDVYYGEDSVLLKYIGILETTHVAHPDLID